MGALPNTLPTTPRKAPARATRAAKLNRYGRDPKCVSERTRGSSDYEAGTGYAPFFHAFLADWGRLSSGHIADMMFMAVLSRSLGRGGKKGEPRPSRTLPLAKTDLAALVNPKDPPLRSVERELARWHKERIADVKEEGPGMVSVELLYRGWEALPDYNSGVVEMPVKEEPVELSEEDEAKPGNQRVTGKRPVRIAAGAASKAFEVKTGIREWRGRVEGPVDCEVSTVVQAGRCETVIRFPDDWLEKVKNSLGRSNVSNDLIPESRHGCRDVTKSTKRVNHPRAGELVALFDDLLAKSAAVLLSMDAPALQKACEAVGDCDHDFLVKFAVNRASSPIRKPAHVAIICGEALASWRAASKAGAGKRLSRAEVDKLIEQENAELARKRAEARKR